MLRLSLAILALAPSAFAQTTWYVDASSAPPGDGSQLAPFASLQFAIDQASVVSGDTLEVAAGTYVEAIDTGGKDLIIDGSLAATAPILDGAGAGRVVTISSGESQACILRGLRIVNGVAPGVSVAAQGGGVLVSGASPRFEEVVFEDNEAQFGGGASVSNGSPVFFGCTFEGNQAEGGGALHVDGGTITLMRCVFTANQVEGLTMPGNGGAVLVGVGASASVTGCTFEDNVAIYSGGGGAIATLSASVNTDIESCVFRSNIPGVFAGPGRGGAILADGPLLAINSTFTGNGAIGMAFDGVLDAGACSGGTYEGCTFEANSAQRSGAIVNATATDCLFIGNIACADGSGRGGAAGGSLLTRCRLVDNYACGEGGGASASTLVDCEVLYNRALTSDSTPGLGGGIYGGTATRCVIQGNLAEGLSFAGPSVGGGAFGSELTRCLVSGNIADEGGGLASGFPVAASENTTFVNNRARLGAGGVLGGGHVGAIVWNNLPDAASAGAQFTYSNLDTPVMGIGNISLDPLFATPAGGDVHLAAGSPCIDAGDPMAPLDPDGSRADMGAEPFDAMFAPVPTSYCRPSRPISCLPLIAASGSVSVGSAAGVTVTATGMRPGVSGLMALGTAPADVLLVLGPFNELSVCVGGTVLRGAVQLTSQSLEYCGGTMTGTVGAAELSALGLMPGDFVYAQFWARDTFAGRVGITDAIEIPIVP